MAVVGCHKEYVEVCEIVVCDIVASEILLGDANPGLYTRLRFALLASSWLPRPLGIVLWRALHVVMIVGDFACSALLFGLTFLLVDMLILPFCTIFFGIVCALHAVLSVAIDLNLFLGRSISFCWSVVGFLVFRTPIGEWRGRSWRIPRFYDDVKGIFRSLLCIFVFGVPCTWPDFPEFKDRKCESWARWWEEVVHSREAIVL